jgi:hypothetical protein
MLAAESKLGYPPIYHPQQQYHSLQWQLALEADLTHQVVINTANTHIIKYQKITQH